MVIDSEKLWELIQDKVNILEEWRHWKAIQTSFSNEQVFITVHENSLYYMDRNSSDYRKPSDYIVRIILFDKPQKWGKGNLHVFKVSSEWWTLDGAKNEAGRIKNELLNLSQRNHDFPILSFLKNEEVFDEKNTFVSETIKQGTSTHRLYLSVNDPDDYLRPFDILKIDRVSHKHVGIYLGRGFICHFSGNEIENSNSSKVERDTLKSFFDGKSGSDVEIIRPIVRFKSKEKIIKDVAKAIASGYGKYDTNNNNCEHFANMIVLGIKYSDQCLNTSSRMVVLGEEIEEWNRSMDNLASPSQELIKEIEELVKETETDSKGDWKERIEVSEPEWRNYWCKLQ